MKHLLWIGLVLLHTAAIALEVQNVRWGFDGHAVPGRFNLLSVLVANPSDSAFDGALNVHKSRGLEDRIGAVYQTSCYLSPLGSRWVQFYLYVDNQFDQWRLEWGPRPDDHKDIDPPKWGAPALVLLTDPQNTLIHSSAFKQFPEDLFPPTATAMSGLGCLLLDHVPRWELAKRQALLDWLREGGTLHLLKGVDGRDPVFADELSVLNPISDRARIGNGLVVRHGSTVQDLRPQDVEEGVISPQKTNQDEMADNSQLGDSFFQTLKTMSRAHYQWGLIYLLAIAYMAAVGPGNLLAGRRLGDYRLRIALLLATVAASTWAFYLAGSRGQGEASEVHTLSYARAVDDDTYDVTQWINVFVAHGAHYTITHAAPHNLYATGQDFEAVNGLIHNGKDGKVLVDIPVFSRRPIIHEAQMKGPHIPLKILEWDGRDALHKLTLTIGSDFSKQFLEGWVVQGNDLYPMKLAGDRLECGDFNKQSLTNELFLPGTHQLNPNYGMQYQSDDLVTNVDEGFRKLVKPLIAWSLGATEDFAHPDQLPLAAEGRTHLFLLAHSPESFAIANHPFGREVGCVLYDFDLSPPKP